MLACHRALLRRASARRSARRRSAGRSPAHAARRLQGARGHDRAGARKAMHARPRFSGPGKAATTASARARVILLAGLRPAGAAARDQRRHHPAAGPARRRRRWSPAAPAAAARSSTTWARRTAAHAFAGATSMPGRRSIEREPIDAIIVNASGCGTTVKDYGHLLARDPGYAERAAKISALAKDVTEFLASTTSARRSAGRRSASPITPPARCSTASASPTSRRCC